MYHSLIISGANTYERWHMVPSSRPLVNLPPVKTNYVEIPGSNITLDYTEMLLGEPAFGQRTGSWEFFLRPESKWAEVYADLAAFIHGRIHTVILEDDPEYYYRGRLSINQWQSQEKYSVLTIDYTFDPTKYEVATGNPIEYQSYTDVADLISRAY